MHVSRLPIIQTPIEKNRIFIKANVTRVLELNNKMNKEKLFYEQQTLQRQINAIGKQIDKLVYELYGLTEDEIKIVEGTG